MLTPTNRLLRLTSSVALSLSLWGLSLPVQAELDPTAKNQFDVCVNDLVRSGVPAQGAAVGCSDALIPKELSECVTQINSTTPISGLDALKSCYQVRRPVDLSNCVSDIYRATPIASLANADSKTEPTEPVDTATPPETPPETPLEALLNSCRQSLLPGRHSECVIALSRDVANTTPVQAMETCLSAEAFPRDLFPAFPGE